MNRLHALTAPLLAAAVLLVAAPAASARDYTPPPEVTPVTSTVGWVNGDPISIPDYRPVMRPTAFLCVTTTWRARHTHHAKTRPGQSCLGTLDMWIPASWHWDGWYTDGVNIWDRWTAPLRHHRHHRHHRKG